MAGMSVSTGLISGIDYDTMITQLMQVEANPQTLLKQQLSATQSDAAAYRAVNTRFDALRTAAAAMTADAVWTTTKASSTDSSVAATATAGATAGSLSFTVTSLAATHSVYTSGTPWATVDTALSATDPTTLTIGGVDVTVPAGKTVADAVKAINDSTAGVTAVAVNTGSGIRIQMTSKTSGAAGNFTVSGDVPVTELTTGTDATLKVGGALGYDVTSSTNTFTDVLPGSTFTVSKKDAAATVTISRDPDATASKMKSLVDSANSLLDAVSSYTDIDSTAAVLKGDSTLRGLANQILGIFSGGVGGVSASTVGVKLTKEGKLEFDQAAFTAKLTSDPAAVKDLMTRTSVTNAGADGISGNADDVTAPVGFAAKLEALAKGASDTTTGSLVLIANSEDSVAKDLQSRIDAWDTRLALRKTTLTRQFTAMETALGTLQNQASWLTSQIASLPSWSSSS